MSLLAKLGPRSWTIIRWWIVGLAFAAVNIGLLYLLHDMWALPLMAATLLAGEIGTAARFLINDRWVFGHPHPTWKRLIEYHAAVASSFCIWWTVANLLPLVGVNYLLASLGGQACSVGWSMVTNFLWIWRKRSPVPAMGAMEATTMEAATLATATIETGVVIARSR
jgi:putative flippase GtrA